MSYLQGPVNYALPVSSDNIPRSLGSSTLAMPIASSVSINSITSQSGTQNAGGLIQFQIPTGSGTGYIKSNSTYLKATVAITAVGDAGVSYFQGVTKSASALINRLTVQIGGTTVDQINNYKELHDALLAHTTNKSYYDYDSAIMEYTATTVGSPNDSTVTVDVVIPVISGFLNNEKDVPAFLFSSPITLLFDINTLLNCVYGANANITNIAISNARIVYEAVKTNPAYEEGIRAMMMAGNLYQMNLITYQNIQVGSEATLNYNIGANLSSVRAVLYTTRTVGALNAQQLFKIGADANAQQNFRLYLNGQLVNQTGNLNKVSQIFAEMNRSLNVIFDSNRTSVASAATYASTYFLGGINCTRFAEDSLAFTGSPAQNINIILEKDAAVAGDITIIFVVHDLSLTVDATGRVSTTR